MKKLIFNAIQTPDGTILESKSRHDCVFYTDNNGKDYMIDGGLEYIRCSANGDEKILSLYDDEPHSIQRTLLKWGSYGKNGDEALKFIPVGNMSTDHIENVLLNCVVSTLLKTCMEKELEERKK